MILYMQNWLDGEKFDCLTGGWRGGAREDDNLESWSNVYFLIRFLYRLQTVCVVLVTLLSGGLIGSRCVLIAAWEIKAMPFSL